MVAAANPQMLLTAEDLLAMPEDAVVLRELWKGKLVEMSPAGGPHGSVLRRLNRSLDDAAVVAGVGEAWMGEVGYIVQRSPDTVIAPDLVLIPISYAANVSMDDRGYHELVPPLVVEVKPPTDRESQMAEKLAIYLESGIKEVWWVRPQQRTITRHWVDRDPIVLGLDDTLDDVEAVPGFTLRLAGLFATRKTS